MTQYLLSVWGGEDMTEAEMEAYAKSGAFEATGKLNDELKEQGKFVFAGGLEASPTRRPSCRADDEGDVVVTDGPYAEIKENLGGFWVLECRGPRRGARHRQGAPRLPAKDRSKCVRSSPSRR